MADKNKKISKLKLERQNKKTQLQTQGISIYKNDELTQINNNILKFQNERIELIEQIGQIKVEIGKLESKKEYYERALSSFVKLRDSLQRDYDKTLLEDKQFYLKSIKSLYEITPSEG
ncbi:MAG: hypothetical protein Q2306_01640 [Phytoplasma sp.]|uniref:hypothetical protein n=1 Tax=Phytoplasma sp. TaxID=2155 RepID=UPI002B40D702|nr:hypothetical protein [Phytoplasma sp.]WRH06591.1 MAG: hypothetical protein Q2306_01640 [Phytoplasma sp.]